MEDYDRFDIYSVAQDPTYCPQCGRRVTTRQFDAGRMDWCERCETVFSRNPLAAVHVVVRDGARVLLLDEPIPQHDGVLSLPGGYARHDEHPSETAARELEEETGLRADPEDLRLLTVVHAELEDVAFYFVTYAVDRDRVEGDLTPEFEGFEARFHPVADLRANPDQIRENDLERVGLAFEE